MPGEIIIEHIPVKGGNQLNVCVPFISSSETSNASELITEIIQKVSSNAPSEGNSTNLNMSNFNLQNIFPRKPFFTYTNENQDYIVFGALEAIPLSSSTITTLQQIIKPYSLATPGNELFYNSKGPTTGLQIGDGLYISCQPTGSSLEDTPVTYDKQNVSSVDLSSILNNPTVMYIIIILSGCLIFIIIFYALNYFYNYISSDNIKLPTLPKFG
jgi:hypothetical protein